MIEIYSLPNQIYSIRVDENTVLVTAEELPELISLLQDVHENNLVYIARDACG